MSHMAFGYPFWQGIIFHGGCRNHKYCSIPIHRLWWKRPSYKDQSLLEFHDPRPSRPALGPRSKKHWTVYITNTEALVLYIPRQAPDSRIRKLAYFARSQRRRSQYLILGISWGRGKHLVEEKIRNWRGSCISQRWYCKNSQTLSLLPMRTLINHSLNRFSQSKNPFRFY